MPLKENTGSSTDSMLSNGFPLFSMILNGIPVISMFHWVKSRQWIQCYWMGSKWHLCCIKWNSQRIQWYIEKESQWIQCYIEWNSTEFNVIEWHPTELLNGSQLDSVSLKGYYPLNSLLFRRIALNSM